jgi:hypothetical protein
MPNHPKDDRLKAAVLATSTQTVTDWINEEFDQEMLEKMEKAGIICQALGFRLSLIASLDVELENALTPVLDDPTLTPLSPLKRLSSIKTSDGYTLYYNDTQNEWADNIVVEFVDMIFKARADGHPIDDEGLPLSLMANEYFITTPPDTM